jgi:hypothetical protein
MAVDKSSRIFEILICRAKKEIGNITITAIQSTPQSQPSPTTIPYTKDFFVSWCLSGYRDYGY